MGRCTAARAVLALAAMATVAPAVEAEPPASDARVSCALRVDFSGVVTPGMARYVEDGIAAARDRSCALLVVVDTPGGRLDATEDIVRAILGSPVPVITFVGPEGARAASAGALVTMAGHVAAMAPSTHLGAAHPVSVGGNAPTTMDEKIVSDVSAFARAIAERRGRNPRVAERMVRESIALTASEALGEGVVDLTAEDERALLAALDGRTVSTPRGPVTLDLRHAEVTTLRMPLHDRVLHRLGDPSVAYLLMVFGTLAILFELTTPALGAAGAVGALSLFLAFLGLSHLPVDVGGVALVVAGVGLLVAELFIVSHGLLAIAGVGCLALGALVLVDHGNPDFWLAPDFAVGWRLLLPTAIGAGAGALVLAGRARRAARRPSTTGREGLVGQVGRATRNIGPSGGEVGVLGERWTAFADEAIDAGAKVRVVEVQGLQLKVRPEPAPGPPVEEKA